MQYMLTQQKNSVYTVCIILLHFVLCSREYSIYAQGHIPNFPSDKITTPYRIATDDSIYINALIKKGNQSVSKQPDSAISIYLNALEISKRIKDTGAIARVYHNLSVCFKGKDMDMSINYMKRSIALNELLGKKNTLLGQYFTLSSLYELKGEYQPIKELYRKVFPLYTKDKTGRELLAKLQNSVGRAYFQTGSYDSASLYYEQIPREIKTADKGNYMTLITAYTGLGIIAARIGADEKGLTYFQKARSLALQFKDTGSMVFSLGNIGVIYYRTRNYETAKSYFRKALSVSTRMHLPSVALNYAMLANTLLVQDSVSEALVYAEKGLKSAQANGHFDKLIPAFCTLGATYLQLKQYRKAEEYIIKGVKLAEAKNIVDNLSNAYLHLSDIYEGMGQYKKALYYKNEYVRLTDSLRGKENAERITQVEMKFKTAEKDLLLSEQKAMLQRKNFWIGSIMISVLLLIIIFVVLYQRNRQGQAASIIQLQQRQEIDLLQTKTDAEAEERRRIGQDLHDGIVSQLVAIKLNINTLQDQNDKEIIKHRIQHIGHQLEGAMLDLRTTAHNLMPEALLQQGLQAALATLCEKTGRNSALTVSFQSYGSLPKLKEKAELSLYRMVQELIQNALRHARATQLLVQLSCQEELLGITVEDNGIGFSDEATKKEKEGVGLRNLRKRVADLNGAIDIISRPGKETTIYLEFELKYLT